MLRTAAKRRIPECVKVLGRAGLSWAEHWLRPAASSGALPDACSGTCQGNGVRKDHDARVSRRESTRREKEAKEGGHSPNLDTPRRHPQLLRELNPLLRRGKRGPVVRLVENLQLLGVRTLALLLDRLDRRFGDVGNDGGNAWVRRSPVPAGAQRIRPLH